MNPTTPRVAVIDTGISNIDSVVRGLEAIGADPFVVSQPDALNRPDRLVLPGVGTFADGMASLRRSDLVDPLTELVSTGVPVLGICLGMQLLADSGDEGGRTDGLGWVPGRVERLRATPEERVPHVGWNEVWPTRRGTVLDGLRPGDDLYFVHSYQFVAAEPGDVIATTPYCGGFVAAVEHGAVSGVQFHPEKSQRAGLAVLRSFVQGVHDPAGSGSC